MLTCCHPETTLSWVQTAMEIRRTMYETPMTPKKVDIQNMGRLIPKCGQTILTTQCYVPSNHQGLLWEMKGKRERTGGKGAILSTII